MRKLALWLCLAVSVVSMSSALVAQNPHYNPGPVWRVLYISTKPGMSDQYWSDLSKHFKPIYDEFKKEGWVVDYKFYTNPESDHPDDWDIAIAIEYKNWGTLDEMAEKASLITEKHYGSREAMVEAGKKRAEIATLIRSSLAREVTLK